MSSLLILVAAGPNDGLGHYMRCRVLAQAAREADAQVVAWLLGSDGGELPAMASGVMVESLPMIGSRLPAELDEYLADNPTDWVVCDSYAMDGERYRQICQAHDTRVLYLDDVPDRVFSADLVLNQNTLRKALYDNSQISSPAFLLGPAYALVAKDYRDADWGRDSQRRIVNILLSFGAGDRNCRAGKVLELLQAWDIPLHIDIVQGPFSKGCAIEQSPGEKHEVCVHRGLDSLAELMSMADLLICAAGSTVWQACAVGTPMIAVQTVENQGEVIRTLHDTGAAMHLPAGEISDGKGSEVFSQLMHRMDDPKVRFACSGAATRLVDGRGPLRVMEALS